MFPLEMKTWVEIVGLEEPLSSLNWPQEGLHQQMKNQLVVSLDKASELARLHPLQVQLKRRRMMVL